MEEKKRSLRNYSQYSQEFKMRAISEVLEDGKSMQETARAYQIRHGRLGKWIAAYMEYGEEGVRPSKATKFCDGG
jgi:transposase-like protein